MVQMKIFDCNCSLGMGYRPPFRFAENAADLIEEMDFCGIDRALVYHAGMRFGSPVVWNHQLCDQIKESTRLEACWTILPPQTGEQPGIEEFLDMMRTHDVKSLWAFPDEHRYRLDDRTFGSLLEEMTRRRIPLFLKQNILATSDLLESFPDLTIVAVNQGPHSLERYLRPLLDEYQKLYLDTSYYIVDGLIEEFCFRYGSGRLLFGSGFPDNCSGSALLRLVQADINAEDKNRIAFKNLEEIISEVRV